MLEKGEQKIRNSVVPVEERSRPNEVLGYAKAVASTLRDCFSCKAKKGRVQLAQLFR